MKKNHIVSPNTKLTLTLLSMSMLLSGLVILFGYLIYDHQVSASQQRTADGVTETCLTLVTADIIDTYYRSGTEDAAYEQIREDLSLCASAAGTRSISILVPIEEGCVFVFDSKVEGRTQRGLGDMIDWESAYGGIDERMVRGEDIGVLFSDDSSGGILTNYTPLIDENGAFVAYLTLEYSATELVADQQNFVSRLSILAFVTSISLTVLFFFIIRRLVIKPLSAADDDTIDDRTAPLD